MSNTNYDLGQIIKYFRIRKKIRQHVLCEGICTPSYLSRIENLLVIADKEIYELLFLKLDLNFEINFKEILEIDSTLDKIYEDLLYKRQGDYEQFFSNIPLLNNEIFIKFQIIHSRYLFSLNKIKEGLSIYRDLKKIRNNFSARNYFLFINLSLYVSVLMKNFNEALKYINTINFNNINNYKLIEQGILLFNTGLIYCHNKNYSNSLSFITLALEKFTKIYLPTHELNCHITLGIIYNNLGLHKNAVSHYEIALNILTKSNLDESSTSINMIQTNLGYNYECQHQFETAEQYYKQALGHSTNIDIPNYINLIRLNYITARENIALEYLEELLKLDFPITPKYYYQMKIFELLLINQKPSINSIFSIQKESLEYFLENKMYTLFFYYSECFAQLYGSINYYKKAYELLQASLDVKKNINLEVI